MAEPIVVVATTRERTGKGGARTLRRDGRIPAILYGGAQPPQKLAVPIKELRLQMTTNPRFFSTVLELEIEGVRTHVLPREAQRHPVTDMPLHFDFIRAEAGATVTVAVPVRFTNDLASPGLKRGGVLNIVRREVELLCPADAIPNELVVDLTGFEIGESIHISHVTLPPGVRPVIADRDFTLASVVPPTTGAAAGEPAAA